jgi:hypothetical protein
MASEQLSMDYRGSATEEHSIDEVVLKHGQQSVAVSERELAAFDPEPKDNTVLHDYVAHGIMLQATDVSFRERGKWRVSDGAATFTAGVEDENFLAAIDDGTERFGKNDLFVADVRYIQRLDSSGKLKQERVIERVIEHRTPIKTDQPTFPIDIPEKEG